MQLCIRITARRGDPAIASSPALRRMLVELSPTPLWSDLCVLHFVLRVMGNTEYGVGVSLGTHHHQTWSSKKAQVRGKVLFTKYTTMKIRDTYIL